MSVAIHGPVPVTTRGLVAGMMLRAGVDLRDAKDEVAGENFDRLSTVEICAEALKLRGLTPPSSGRETIREAVSTGAAADVFTPAINAVVLDAFRSSQDSTPFAHETKCATFSEHNILHPTTAETLDQLPRGAMANHASARADATPWKLKRFAKQLIADEQDLLDDVAGVLLLSAQEIGRAARRVRPDLVWSMLLSNPTLATDGTAVFHADHSNLATTGSALSAATLRTAIAAVGNNQVRQDAEGRPVHVGGRAAHLVVPPDLQGLAAELIRDLTVPNTSITLHSETRIGSVGVVDENGSTQTGSATNWFLTGNGQSNPSVVVGYLDGKSEPTTTKFDLGQGQWGIGYATKLDIAVKAIDYRDLYRATGEE